MHQFWSKAVAMLAAGGLFATMAGASVGEFNAINAAARERGDHAALVENVRKLAAFTPGHPAIQAALARGLAQDGDRAGAVAQLNRIADLGFSFKAADDSAFQGLKDDPGFVAAAQRLAENGNGRDVAIGLRR
jgi:hypothetical protein